jgi:nucleotide-binding universal stress UspA family protein
MGAKAGRIVVGYDGGADAVAALDWALHTARLEQRALRVVVAASAMDPVLVSDFHERTERFAEEWRAEAEDVVKAAQLADASVEVAHGPAVAVLLRSVAAGDMLVVGSRGHAPLIETLGGSVSQHLARHAKCPVVVVRPPAGADARGIVVGVDWSPESLAALRFACARARLTGEDVTVLHSHWAWWPEPSTRDVLAGRLSDWVRPLREEYSDVRIAEEVFDGAAPELLVHLSRSASLLVLGNRGRDAFVDLLLGSTSQDALHRARCPVAVVR